MKNFSVVVFLCILLYVCTISCENQENSSNRQVYNPSRRVTLSSFHPQEGRIAEKMLLDGDNFGSDPSIIRVYFNDKPASVLSSTGGRIYALCPRMPGDECVISVVVGNDSVVYDEKFTYHVSVSVSTVAGNGIETFRAGNLADAQLRPSHLTVDNENNIFVALRQNVPQRGLARINEGENVMIPLLLDGTLITPNALCVDRNTGIIYIPCESGREIFYTMDPREGWAPRRRSFTWRNLNGNALPSNSWKHSMGFCYLEGYEGIYTRFFDGQIVRIDPRTYEADIISMSPNGTCVGVTFHPLRPELLYIAGRSGGMSQGIYVFDVRNPDDPPRRLNPAGRGHRDGDISVALFDNPWQIYFDPYGYLYIADADNHCIRRMRPDNFVETVVGIPGTAGWRDGGRDEALFDAPMGVGVDKDGTVYVADWNNNRIRKLAME